MMRKWHKNETKEMIGLLRSRLELCNQTGRLTWKLRDISSFVKTGRTSVSGKWSKWNSRYYGKEAFTSKLQSTGSYRGRIDGFDFMKSRVVFCISRGFWPKGVLIHDDGNLENFTPSNLKEISQSEKTAMSKTKGGKHTGFRGVHYRTHNGDKKRPCGKDWDVYFLGKFRGSYAYPIEAAQQYDILAKSHFGENCRTNNTIGGLK